MKYLSLIACAFFYCLCFTSAQEEGGKILEAEDVSMGSDLFMEKKALWQGKRLALVVHQGSTLSNGTHLVDTLLAESADIAWIYAPEHGVRGTEDAGKDIPSGVDPESGLEIKSLYGKNKRPNPKDLAEINVVVFDLQDVGARFYTYLSTLAEVLEAASEAGVECFVLDRPNPNGYYVDGPVLDTSFQSFVGRLPIPVVHGMTLGELTHMMIGEEWIGVNTNFSWTVLGCNGYSHNDTYRLPVKPSPNLPNLRSVLLYPGLCFFEGTSFSVGRGTNTQFQVVGHPQLEGEKDFSFVPRSSEGARQPKREDERCYGLDLSDVGESEIFAARRIPWNYLWDLVTLLPREEWMERPGFLDLLFGTARWRDYLPDRTVEEWRLSYEKELEAFIQKRKNYLLYPAGS